MNDLSQPNIDTLVLHTNDMFCIMCNWYEQIFKSITIEKTKVNCDNVFQEFKKTYLTSWEVLRKVFEAKS